MKTSHCLLPWRSRRLISRLAASGIPLVGVLTGSTAAAMPPGDAIPASTFPVALIAAAGIAAILFITLLGRQLTIRHLRRDLDRLENEHRRMQTDLQRFTAIMNQASEAITITDAQSHIVYINPAFTSLMGYTRRDAHGQTPRLFRTDRHDDHFYQEMRETLRTKHVWKGTFTNRCKDGTEVELETVITAVLDDRGQIANYVSAARDVTHEHQLETQLRNAQKMEALGTLAGGIAHDFNNILSAIIGFSELGTLDAPEGTPVRDHFNQVLKASRRAADLVAQILTFSRRDARERQPLLLEPIVDEALKLLRGTLPATVEIQKTIEEDMPPIMADTAQMHQIIMNLCTNANHAMRGGNGVLEISLEPVRLDPEDVMAMAAGMHPGRYLQLAVSDTGCGMDKATMEKMFEPYFTTKKKGEGTGLGLSVVYGIVHSYGGHISVYSDLGKGSIFKIYLPVLESSGLGADEVVADQAPLPRGSERILAVDDEETIFTLEKNVLEGLGYKVTALGSSREALERFTESPGSFDLVITDMTMPEMNGTELAREILAIRPGIPIILCTGFSEAVNEEKAKAVGIKAYVMKPVLIRDLAQVVRKVLDEGSSKLKAESTEGRISNTE